MTTRWRVRYGASGAYVNNKKLWHKYERDEHKKAYKVNMKQEYFGTLKVSIVLNVVQELKTKPNETYDQFDQTWIEKIIGCCFFVCFSW